MKKDMFLLFFTSLFSNKVFSSMRYFNFSDRARYAIGKISIWCVHLCYYHFMLVT